VIEHTSPESVVVLGTGGTIAGAASCGLDNLGYTAAQLGVAELLAGVRGLSSMLMGRQLKVEQLAQVDSKDMDFSVWQLLVDRVAFHLAQDDVKGVVVTHGTDTLEETAFFLHAVLPAALLVRKPVVLTCAMRPATSVAPDGPQNLLDAVAVANTDGAGGVMVVCAGVLHGALEVQKVHPYRLNAFDSGDAGSLGYVEEGRVRQVRNWPVGHVKIDTDAIKKIANVEKLPRVEIVMSHAGAGGALVDALMAPGIAEPVQGLVVACTGNGTVHYELEAALLKAQATGVSVVRSTRCAYGQVLPVPGQLLPDSHGLSPVKARVALMLALLG
jgi:L-asparaginase